MIGIVLGWSLLVISIIGWPVSAVTFAKQEPATVLGLSWFAIVISAATYLESAYVKRKQDEEDS